MSADHARPRDCERAARRADHPCAVHRDTRQVQATAQGAPQRAECSQRWWTSTRVDLLRHDLLHEAVQESEGPALDINQLHGCLGHLN